MTDRKQEGKQLLRYLKAMHTKMGVFSHYLLTLTLGRALNNRSPNSVYKIRIIQVFFPLQTRYKNAKEVNQRNVDQMQSIHTRTEMSSNQISVRGPGLCGGKLLLIF